ncbi:MAG: SIMPL domain-containing protein [Dehalococcoidales bacterium]|jgi:uncharacterized protein YggE
MKHFRLLTIIALLALLTPVGIAGCSAKTTETAIPLIDSNQQAGIWVTGEGKVTVKPDIANISLGVSSQEASVADAMVKTKDAMSKVMAALKANNIDDKDIQTQQYNINPAYTYNPQTGSQSVSGYQVTNIVNVKLRDTSSVATVINAVADAGGNLIQINSVTFTVEDPTQYYTEARQKAIADADHKAQKLASLYGITLDKPSFVSEYSSNPPVYNYSSQGYAIPAPVMAPPVSISTGSADIILYIQASYPIVK